MKIINQSVVVLVIIPVFIVWKLLVGQVILPIVTKISAFTAETIYEELEPELFYNQNMQEWQLKTVLFKVNKPYLNNTYRHNFKITGSTDLVIGHLEGFTLGLPLFWLLIILFSFKKRQHLLRGTVYLLAITCANVILLVYFKVTSYLHSSTLLRIYNEPYIQIPSMPPVWSMEIIKPLLDTIGYMNILIMPVWLAFYYCQQHNTGDLKESS